MPFSQTSTFYFHFQRRSPQNGFFRSRNSAQLRPWINQSINHQSLRSLIPISSSFFSRQSTLCSVIPIRWQIVTPPPPFGDGFLRHPYALQSSHDFDRLDSSPRQVWGSLSTINASQLLISFESVDPSVYLENWKRRQNFQRDSKTKDFLESLSRRTSIPSPTQKNNLYQPELKRKQKQKQKLFSPKK